MIVRIEYILKLIDILSERTAQSKDFYGFRKMSEIIDDEHVDVSPRYLDELYRKVSKKHHEGVTTCRASSPHLDAISHAMGYLNFQQFCNSCDYPISSVLEACTGNWWSYFRAPAGNYIFRSPVRIFRDQLRQTMRMDLKGRERVFSGKIDERSGCLSGFLESGTDKRIGLVFKLGRSRHMELIQGVFCGISMGDPVAGREICIRETGMEYEEMSWSSHLLDDKTIDYRIRDFFSEYEMNCIKIKDISGFEIEDLK
jgi:hypothetical protein